MVERLKARFFRSYLEWEHHEESYHIHEPRNIKEYHLSLHLPITDLCKPDGPMLQWLRSELEQMMVLRTEIELTIEKVRMSCEELSQTNELSHIRCWDQAVIVLNDWVTDLNRALLLQQLD